MNAGESSGERQRFGEFLWRLTALILVCLGAAMVILATEIWLSLFAALLFSVFLVRCSRPIARWLHVPYAVGLAIVCSLLIGSVVAGIVLFGIQVQQQWDSAEQQLARGVTKLQELARESPPVRSILSSAPLVRRLLDDDEELQMLNDSGSDSESPPRGSPGESGSGQDSSGGTTSGSSAAAATSAAAREVLGWLGGLFQTTFGLALHTVLIFFVGLFLAVQPDLYQAGLVRLFPPSRRGRVTEILGSTGEALWWWMLGRFGSMLVTGGGAALILALLGVPMAVSLGVVTALLTFVPNIGAAIALVLAVLAALPQSATTALLVVPSYISLQLLESYVVTPLIQQRQISLPPAVLIAFQAVLGVLLGFMGAALASPLLAALRVVVQEAYIRDQLEGNPTAGS